MIVLPSIILAALSVQPNYDLIAARRYRATHQRSGQRGRAAASQSPRRDAAVPLPRARPAPTFLDRFSAIYGEPK